MRRLAQALFITLPMVVTACGQDTDPKIIEGHWVAENFRVQSIKLPVGPDLFISKNHIRLGSSMEAMQLRGVEVDSNEITLKTEFGFDIVFAFENKNRMYFTVPFMGDRIYYQRDGDTMTTAVRPANTSKTSVQASAKPTAATQVEAPTKPSGIPAEVAAPAPTAPSQQGAVVPKQEPANLEPKLQQPPASETHYQQALEALRRGDENASLRFLSAALTNGFADWPRIEQEPLFARLHDDMRFQVLQSRWKKR